MTIVADINSALWRLELSRPTGQRKVLEAVRASVSAPKRAVQGPSLLKSALPRSIRQKIEKLPVGRRHKTAVPKSPPSPNQEAANNRNTGRLALGPWGGPFSTHPESASDLPQTLYMDVQGMTHLSLESRLPLEEQPDMSAVKQLLLTASKLERPGNPRLQQGRPQPRYVKPFEAKRGVKSRKTMPVNQPRASYY